mgnify:FL=1
MAFVMVNCMGYNRTSCWYTRSEVCRTLVNIDSKHCAISHGLLQEIKPF